MQVHHPLRSLMLAAGVAAAPLCAGAALTTIVGSSPFECTAASCPPVDTEAKAGSLAVPNPGAAISARANFLSGLSSSFGEEFSVDQAGGFDPGNILGGRGSIAGSGPQTSSMDGSGSNFLGRWNTTAANEPLRGWWENDGRPGSQFEVTLHADQTPQNAVGFYLTDFGDFNATADLYLDDVLAGPIGPASTVEGQVLFFGAYSSQPFSKVAIKINCTPVADCIDVAGLDSFVLGLTRDVPNPTPEPGSLALLALALLGAGAASRRRRS